MISVEVASPTSIHTYMATPNDIRGMVGWLQAECVVASGRGGFITHNIANLLSYVMSSTSSVRLLNSYRKLITQSLWILICRVARCPIAWAIDLANLL